MKEIDTKQVSARTTYKRNVPSPMTQRLRDSFNPTTILDYGCGKGRNSYYLKNNGWSVYLYDINPVKAYGDLIVDNFVHKIPYEVILCSYVLNVLDMDDRIEVMKHLQTIRSRWIIFEVRHQYDINLNAPTWKPYKDGYITKSGSFQKGYTDEELVGFIREYFPNSKIVVEDTNINSVAVAVFT